MAKLVLKDFIKEEVMEFFVILFTILLSLSLGVFVYEKYISLGPILVIILGLITLGFFIRAKAIKRFENYKKLNN